MLLGDPDNVKEGLAPVTISDLLNEAPRSKFHRRAVLISGMGFFTDSYDLFVIGTVAAIVTTQWHLSTTEASWVTGAALRVPLSELSCSGGSRTSSVARVSTPS